MTQSGLHVCHIDLSQERPDPIDPPADSRGTFVIFWWGDLPLGYQTVSAEELPLSVATLDALRTRFAAEQRAARDPALGAPLIAGAEGAPHRALTLAKVDSAGETLAWLDLHAAPSTQSAGDLSVIICTRDRGSHLALCIQSLLAQRSPPGEVIVVDNSANANAAELCRTFPSIRYVHEPRPGLSQARNTGIEAAKRSLIVFTDDDVTPHAGWTAELVRAFANPDIDAVTGLVLPGRLDTHAQQCFQLMMGGLGGYLEPVLFDGNFFAETRDDGAHVWCVGAGANMAFRRAVFDRIGGFDPRLGAGASGCSEDSELWYRLLAGGGSCLYEPRAVVFHDHRPDWPSLERQIHAYMRGHVAALVVQSDTFGHRGNIRRIFRQLPRYFARTAFESVLNATPDRRRLLRREITGWFAGLSYLMRPGWRRHRSPLLRLETTSLREISAQKS